MKILILIMAISFLLLMSCDQNLASNHSSTNKVFCDSLSNDGDMFELNVPKDISVKKHSWMDEVVSYTFFDSLSNPFLSLSYGFYTEVDIFETNNKENVKMDTFYLVGIKNRGFFVGDSLKKEKIHMYDISLSSQCLYVEALSKPKSQNDHMKKFDMNRKCIPKKMWFSYDSSKVDENVCYSIISSLKYRKK